MKVCCALVLLLVFAVAVPFAYAQDVKTRGEAGDVLTPLAMGNTWVYQGDTDGFVSTDRIEGVVLFESKPWYLLRSYERAADEPEDKNVSLDLDLWLAHIDGHECDAFLEISEDSPALKLGPIGRFYRYPATLGDTYKPYQDDPTIVVTVIAHNEKVTTAAGTFDCVVYKETNTEDPDYASTSYAAPGVGMVKVVTVEADQTSRTELIRYTLKK